VALIAAGAGLGHDLGHGGVGNSPVNPHGSGYYTNPPGVLLGNDQPAALLLSRRPGFEAAVEGESPHPVGGQVEGRGLSCNDSLLDAESIQGKAMLSVGSLQDKPRSLPAPQRDHAGGEAGAGSPNGNRPVALGRRSNHGNENHADKEDTPGQPPQPKQRHHRRDRREAQRPQRTETFEGHAVSPWKGRDEAWIPRDQARSTLIVVTSSFSAF